MEREKDLLDTYNDELELRENARNRQIANEHDTQNKAMNQLVAEAEKMPRELFEQLPTVNDWNTRKTLVMHGIPHPDDPPNPLRSRDASNTPLEGLANEAWGTTKVEAVAVAAREDDRRAALPRESLFDLAARKVQENTQTIDRVPQRELKDDRRDDYTHR